MEAAGSYWLDVSCRKPAFPSAGVWFGMEVGRGIGPVGVPEGSEDYRSSAGSLMPCLGQLAGAVPISKRFRCENKNKFNADQL